MICHINLVNDWKLKFLLQGIKVYLVVLLTIIWSIIFSGVKPLRKAIFLYTRNFRCLKIPTHKKHRYVEIPNIHIATSSTLYLINAYLFRLLDPVLAGYFLRVIVMPLSTVLQHLTICKTLHKRKYNKKQNLCLLRLSKIIETMAFTSQTVNITRWGTHKEQGHTYCGTKSIIHAKPCRKSIENPEIKFLVFLASCQC